MKARRGLDPGDVIEIDIDEIVEEIDDIFHKRITKVIGSTVDHAKIYHFVKKIVDEHNKHEAELDKNTKALCPYCSAPVCWRVTVKLGFFCRRCGLVWEEPLDPLDYDEKATKENESERLGRLIYKFKGAKT